MIHTPNDGRGPRSVYLDGKLIVGAFYADTEAGIVKAYIQPLSVDPVTHEARFETLQGAVEVI